MSAGKATAGKCGHTAKPVRSPSRVFFSTRGIQREGESFDQSGRLSTNAYIRCVAKTGSGVPVRPLGRTSLGRWGAFVESWVVRSVGHVLGPCQYPAQSGGRGA